MTTAPGGRWTLVWIDARTAIVLRWRDGPQVTHHDLETPPHEKSVGHIRHDPMRHGGGRAQTTLETHRLEHLRQGLEGVQGAIPGDDDVLVIGPGYVREHLASELRNDDRKHERAREVRSEPAPRMTEPQLVERLRDLVGEPAPRVRSTTRPTPGRFVEPRPPKA